MAATVPRTVAMAEATRAIMSVLLTAEMRPEEFCMPPVKRDLYREKENPVQLPSDFASVNENTAMNTIGAYRTTRISAM